VITGVRSGELGFPATQPKTARPAVADALRQRNSGLSGCKQASEFEPLAFPSPPASRARSQELAVGRSTPNGSSWALGRRAACSHENSYDWDAIGAAS